MAGACKVAVTRAAANTSTGTQDFTVSGFGTPKAALIIVTSGVTDGTPAADAQLSVGATDGTRQWAASAFCDDNTANQVTHRQIVDTACVKLITTADDAVAAFSAWITDGIRLNWTDAPPAAVLVTVILFGGADLTAYAAALNLPNANPVDVTAPGFEPDLVFACVAGANVNTAIATQWMMSVGVAHNDRAGTVVQRCLMTNLESNSAAGSCMASLRTDAVCGQMQNTIDWQASIGSFDSSGFTLTPTANAGGDEMGYLAIRLDGCSSWVGGFDSPTATGDQAITSPGFTPQFVLIVPGLRIAVDNVAVSTATWPFGVAAITSAAQYCNAWANEQGAATINAQSVSDDKAINLDLDTGADGFDATFSSFDANGWTLNFSAVDGTVRKWFALAIEEEQAGGVTENPSPVGIAASIAAIALSLSQAGAAFGSIAGVTAPAVTLSSAAGSVSFSGTVGAEDHATLAEPAVVGTASSVAAPVQELDAFPDPVTEVASVVAHETALGFAPDPVTATFGVPEAIVGRAEFPEPVTVAAGVAAPDHSLVLAQAAVGASGGVGEPGSSMSIAGSPVTATFSVPAVTAGAVTTFVTGGWAVAGQAFVPGAQAGDLLVPGAVAGELG